MINWRKTAFVLKELFSKNKITSHYKDIVSFFEHNKLNDGHVDNILQHAISQVPYYKNISKVSLEQFPVLDKSIIKSDRKLFNARNFLDQKLITMTTSGSTGTPFSVYQDLNKKARNHADTLYFGGLGGYEIGNKMLYLKVWAKQKMSHPLIYKLQDIIPIDVISLSDSQIRQFIYEIKSNKNKHCNILGYVSALEQIIRYCENNNIKQIKGKLTGIITMSEGLSIFDY